MRIIVVSLWLLLALYSWSTHANAKPQDASPTPKGDFEPILTESEIACFYYPLLRLCNGLVNEDVRQTDAGTVIGGGPSILVLSPQANTVVVPTTLNVQFVSTDSPIVVQTLKVLVSKKVFNSYLPQLDVTKKVMPYATAKGVYWPNADIPKGDYKFLVSISDEAGNHTKQQFEVRAVKGN